MKPKQKELVKIAEDLLNPNSTQAGLGSVHEWLRDHGFQVPTNREAQLRLALELLECNDISADRAANEGVSAPKRKRTPVPQP